MDLDAFKQQSGKVEAPDTKGITTVNEYTYLPAEKLPPVKGVSSYKWSAQDKVVQFPINVWIGWLPIVAANHGFAPNAESIFFKDYGFSRGVTIISGMLSTLFLPLWRFSLRLLGKTTSEGRKSILGRRTLIVGTDKSAEELLRRLRSRVSDRYDVLGFVDVNRKRVGEELAGLPIVGSTDNIGKIIQDLRASDVIFSTQTLSYSDILSVIGRTRELVYLQFVMGILGGIPATPQNLIFLVESAKSAIGDFKFSVCAAGKMQFRLCTQSLMLGGDARVGLEDNLYLDKGVIAKSNAEQVSKIIRIAKELGFKPATPNEARKILNLKGLGKVNF